jgi:hypothetical protein
MMTASSHGRSPEEHRLQAVLALFSGKKLSQVSTMFGICRSDLYKLGFQALRQENLRLAIVALLSNSYSGLLTG